MDIIYKKQSSSTKDQTRRIHLANGMVALAHLLLLAMLLSLLRPSHADRPPPPDTTPEGLSRYNSLRGGANSCVIANAKGDNVSDDTAAVQAAIDDCHQRHPLGAVVVFEPGKTYRVTASVALASNLTLLIGPQTSIFSANYGGMNASTPIVQNPRCPTLYWAHGPTAVLCGTNLTSVAIVGADEFSSIVDGGGWPWYAAGVANHSLQGVGPRLFELAWSSNVTLSRVGFHNSPSWTLHPTYCSGVLAEHIQIHNPRFTPNTDGFDPDASTDVILRDSTIDTGDDGISIKSGNSSACRSCGKIQVPAKNIHIYRTKVLSRNFCVGSATYGGVYDLVMEDSEIGDDMGSSPWAIKYKSHQSFAGTMRNHTFRRIRVGNIQPNSYQQKGGGYFISIELRYHPLIPNRTCHVNRAADQGDCPIFQDITFKDIVATGAARCGDIAGFKGDLLSGLTFDNVTFKTVPKKTWTCGYVDTNTFVAKGVSPPLTCSVGPAGSPTPACAAVLNASGCSHGPGVRGCRKCLGCKSPDKGGCNITVAAKVGCTEAEIGNWCTFKSDDQFSGGSNQAVNKYRTHILSFK